MTEGKEGGPKRLSVGARRYIRSEKARIRREAALAALQRAERKVQAEKGLTVLDLRLLKYLSNDGKVQVELPTDAHNSEASINLGKFLAQKINQDWSVDRATELGKVALDFVEREWTANALGLTKRDERDTVISSFLNACAEPVQNYLDEEEPVHHLTRLQEARNRVIDHITGELVARQF